MKHCTQSDPFLVLRFCDEQIPCHAKHGFHPGRDVSTGWHRGSSLCTACRAKVLFGQFRTCRADPLPTGRIPCRPRGGPQNAVLVFCASRPATPESLIVGARETRCDTVTREGFGNKALNCEIPTLKPPVPRITLHTALAVTPKRCSFCCTVFCVFR